MISLRSVRDLLTEAVRETLDLAGFLIRRADERYVLSREEEEEGR